HLGNKVRSRQSDTLLGGASKRNPPDHPVLLADIMGVKEAAEFLGLRVSRHCRSQSHAEPFGADSLDAPPGAGPCPLPATVVVTPRGRTVEANLERYAIARHRMHRRKPAPGKQHSVGEDRGRRRRRARGNDLTNIRQHKRLPASNKNLAYAELCGFASYPLYPLDAQRAPRSLGRRAHTTIVTAQIAVEIGVKPQARAYRSIFSDILRSFTAPEHPSGTAFFDG